MSKSDAGAKGADRQTDSHHAETQSESARCLKRTHVPTEKNVSVSAGRATKKGEKGCIFI